MCYRRGQYKEDHGGPVGKKLYLEHGVELITHKFFAIHVDIIK